MYQSIHCCKKTGKVWILDDKAGMIESDLTPYYYAYRKSPRGTYTSIYGDKLEKVDINPWEAPNSVLFESDVPIETRVLIDVYGDSDELSTSNRPMVLDIEVSSEGGFPDIKKADKEITAIAIYDSANDLYFSYILDPKKLIQDVERDNVSIKSFEDEESLLKAFFKKYKEISPTIITGWNVDFFDIPYLIHRSNKVFGENFARKLSPIGIVTYNKFQNKYKIAGVSCLDYLLLYKRFSGANEPNYRLDSIGKKEVNMGKIEFQGSLDKLLETDINKYVEYNLNDVKIVVALENKLQFIDLARSICHVGHVSYEDFHISSRFLEGAILTYLRKNNLVAPNKPEGGRELYAQRMEEDDEGFSGAYVKDPVPGKYEWIFDLDLASLYPSIIMSLNISPETKIAAVNNWDPIRYIKGELEQIEFREDSDISPMSCDDFKTFISKENYSISSNGILYRQDKKGLLGEILDKWFDERVKYRKLAKKYADSGDKEKYIFYNRRQQVQKILLNSLYGVLGLEIFRFYDLDNAASVTKTGVTIIQTTLKIANQFYNSKLGTKDEDYIIYSDTDSTFLSALPWVKKLMPEIDINDEKSMSEAILHVASDVQDHINKSYDVMAQKMFNIPQHRFHIKQEVIAKTGIWLAKKRYAQWIINNNGVACDELEIKGIDVVRTSFPTAFKKITKEIIKDILQGKDKAFLDNKILTFKRNLKDVEIVDIAKNTAVKELGKFEKKNRVPFSSTINGTPAHALSVIAHNDFLKKHGLSKKYEPIIASQKIKWVYLKQNELGIEKIAFKGDGADCPEIMEFIKKYIDRTAMYEQDLIGKLEQFYKALKWDVPSENDAKVSKFFEF